MYQLSDINFLSVREIIKSNPKELIALLAPLTERRYHLKHLDIDRNTYLNWERLQIVPYERKDTGWRKFSFIESLWLKCILEFRSLGVSLEQIRKVKEYMWPNNMVEELKEIFYNGVRNAEDFPEKEKIIALYEDPNIPISMWAEILADLSLDWFGLLVYSTIISTATLGITINKSGEINLLNFSILGKGFETQQQFLHNAIQQDSFVFINLSNIILQLSTNEKMKLDSNALIHIISSDELEILKEIRSGKFTEIIIKVADGQPTHIRMKENEVTSDIIKKVSPFLRKGQYSEINLKTRDGQLISFSETKTKKLR